jgi:hypothetical protein
MLKHPSTAITKRVFHPSILKHLVTFYATVMRRVFNIIVLMIGVLSASEDKE